MLDFVFRLCEEHSYLVAKAEYDNKKPVLQPDPAKNIIARLNSIVSDGMFVFFVSPFLVLSTHTPPLSICSEN